MRRMTGGIARSQRGSLSAEMAVVAGVCVVVMVVMSNICLYLVRAAQFERISGEVARSLSVPGRSAQEEIERAMGLSADGAISRSQQFRVTGSQGADGGVCGSKTVTFELEYQPLISHIGVGRLSVTTPVLRRTKSYQVPTLGYEPDQGDSP
ncbi:MAG: hypothetical protein FWG78_04855 [Coriobacteriia bacterium]|nr:hypothetical protein [Coriobacteriia bacterium]